MPLQCFISNGRRGDMTFIPRDYFAYKQKARLDKPG